MRAHAVVDVSAWSRFETKQRHPLWWGIMGLVVVEVTVVAGFLVSYFYLALAQGPRPDFEGMRAWPPPGIEPLPLLYPTISLLLLGFCAWSMFYAGKAMRKEQRGRLVASFVACSIAGGAVLYLRWLQLQLFPFRWDEHAYGSMVWLLTGFHFVHVTSAVIGTAAIGVLAAKGYYGKKRMLAVDVDTLYWYFVSFAWAPIYLVLYWSPRVL